MTLQEIQYRAQSIISKWRDDDSAPYIEFVEELAHMIVPEPSEDLEEASSKFATRIASNGVSVEFLEEKLSFQEGAKWQKEQDEREQADLFTIVALDAAQRAKEQMMQGALNGWLDEDNEPPYDLNVVCEEKIPFGKFKHGDKVKLIIIKEE